MKIFEYDLKAGKRLDVVLDNRSVVSGHGSGSVVKTTKDSRWLMLDKPSAADRQQKPITASQYGKEAICFCIGELFAGTDSAWEWVISK
jgi:hypothetical protein